MLNSTNFSTFSLLIILVRVVLIIMMVIIIILPFRNVKTNMLFFVDTNTSNGFVHFSKLLFIYIMNV